MLMSCTESKPTAAAATAAEEDEKSPASDSEEEDTTPPASPKDIRENIKSKFLVEMPEDFYSFWELVKSMNPKDPCSECGLCLVIFTVRWNIAKPNLIL